MTSKLDLKSVLVVAMLVALLIQGYQAAKNQPTTIEVKLPDGFGKTTESQNPTVLSESQSPPAQTPISNSSVEAVNATPEEKAPAPQAPAEPVRIRDIQKAKYEYDYHYKFDMKLSASPIAYVPWIGNGVPFINLYYRNVDGTAFEDTGMKHNGFVYSYGYVGYSLCGDPLMRFWNWKVVPPPATEFTNRSLVYWSNPAPDDPNNLFQNGENCYTRVNVTSSWMVYACMEGDGKLDPYWEETTNGTIVDHFDFMDICFTMLVETPSVPSSSPMIAITDPDVLEAMSERPSS